MIDAGHDPRRFATDLLERFRDLIVLQAVPDAAARGVVDAPDDVLERMREQAARLGTATLTRYAEVVHAGLGEMRGATAPRLLLEVVCARLLLPSASDTESALLQRVERIETRLDMSIPADATTAASPGGSHSTADQAREAVRPQDRRRPRRAGGTRAAGRAGTRARARNPRRAGTGRAAAPVTAARAASGRPSGRSRRAAAAAGEPDAAAVRRQWTTVLDKVRERSRSLAVMLAGAIVRAVEADTLVLSHESAPLAKRLGEQRNAEVIADALKDALGVDWKVRYEVGSPTDVPAAVPVARRRRREVQPTKRTACSPRPAATTSETPRRDPEEAALELLQNELGARRIDGG